MTLRSNFVFLFFILFSISAQSQSDMEDVVYLKNGRVTKGVILELIPDSTLKIQTKDRNIFVYNFTEIAKVVKEKVTDEKKAEEKVQDSVDSKSEYAEIVPVVKPTPPKPKEEFKTSGYQGILKLGPLGLHATSFNLINGYQFNPNLFLGLGVGLDTYSGIGTNVMDEEVTIIGPDDSQQSSYFLPIYLDFRFQVSNSKATFFTYFDIGYSPYLGWKGRLDTTYVPIANYLLASNPDRYKVIKGGTFFCPGIGLKVFITKNTGIIIDFGLKLQTYQADAFKVSHTYYSSPGIYSYAGAFNKIAISPMVNIGIFF